LSFPYLLVSLKGLDGLMPEGLEAITCWLAYFPHSLFPD
jgi:hypothetical protein